MFGAFEQDKPHFTGSVEILSDPVSHAATIESLDRMEPAAAKESLDPEQNGFFGDLFGMLFKEEEQQQQIQQSKADQAVVFKTKLESSKEQFSNVEIPPFKTISASFETIDPITSTKTPIAKQPDAKIVEQPAAGKENATAIKNILLDLLGENKNEYSTTTSTTTTTKRPEQLNFPVHGIPYIASNLHMKPQTIENSQYSPIRNNLDFLLSDFNKAMTPSYQPDDQHLANTESYVVNPVDLDQLKKHQSESPAQIFAKPSNPIKKSDLGLLKLAGCNIYGRMYRVGRIISELSGPCLECKCTEVGVNCTPLGC